MIAWLSMCCKQSAPCWHIPAKSSNQERLHSMSCLCLPQHVPYLETAASIAWLTTQAWAAERRRERGLVGERPAQAQH